MLHFFVNTETHGATQSEQVNFYTERCKLTGSWYRGSLSTQTSSQPGSGPFVRVTFLPACKFHVECVTFFHLPPSPPLMFSMLSIRLCFLIKMKRPVDNLYKRMAYLSEMTGEESDYVCVAGTLDLLVLHTLSWSSYERNMSFTWRKESILGKD